MARRLEDGGRLTSTDVTSTDCDVLAASASRSECRLAVTLRTRLSGLAACHVNQDAGHPNSEFFWISRPVVPGTMPTPSRWMAAYEEFRAKADLGATPDWHLPSIRLPLTLTSGLCWKDPHNMSYDAEVHFSDRVARYSAFAARHDEFWKRQRATFYAPCNPVAEDCSMLTSASLEAVGEPARRHDWKLRLTKSAKNITSAICGVVEEDTNYRGMMRPMV
jgi:hypothetical protein